MDFMVSTLLLVLLLIPLAAPAVFLWKRRATRQSIWTAVLTVANLAATVAYGLWGMQYEDSDRAAPLWWQLGQSAAGLETVLFSVRFLFSLKRQSDKTPNRLTSAGGSRFEGD